MWILGSLCDSLQEQVVTTPGKAKALWDHLKDLFHDNKDAKDINLDNELRSIKIGKMTVNEYCTKIKSMANRLKNLDCQVSEKNLVIYAINGLDSRFATLFEIIQHREPLLTLETFTPPQGQYTLAYPQQHQGLLSPAPAHYGSQATSLPSAFSTMTLQDPTWHMDTGVNMIRSMRLFKHKFHVDGTLSRYKTRLVANGSSQQLGVDFDETFNPVVKPATIRTVLSLVVSRQWPIHQLDVNNAFLNGDLSETVCMHQPPGFVDSRLCLTGWFYHSRYDSSLFIYRKGSQRKYAIQLLERAHMVHCNPSRTPIDIESKLGQKVFLFRIPLYIAILQGGLQYLTFTRPNLSYAVQQVCLYMQDLREPHFAALKRILRYVTPLHAGLLQVIVFLWVIIFCLGQLNVSTPSLALVPKLNIVVLLTLSHRLHGFTIYFVSYILLYQRPLLFYYDNVSAVYMSANPVQHQRTKHTEIDIHFVCDMVTAGQVRVLHVPSRYQYADIFTKGLPSALFEDF
ncbi:ribonuclease H-like domain-containing protein [Tanacetum coccineum]